MDQPPWPGPRLAALEAACLEAGCDPAAIGRTAGFVVQPTSFTGAADVLGAPVGGSVEQIADGFRVFPDGGFTQIEVVLWPATLAALDAVAPV